MQPPHHNGPHNKGCNLLSDQRDSRGTSESCRLPAGCVRPSSHHSHLGGALKHAKASKTVRQSKGTSQGATQARGCCSTTKRPLALGKSRAFCHAHSGIHARERGAVVQKHCH